MLPIENKMVKEENLQAIKNSLFVSDVSIGRLYGKTGTGVVDGQNSNGWFIALLNTANEFTALRQTCRMLIMLPAALPPK